MHQPDDMQELIQRLLELGAELDQQRVTVAKAIAVAQRLATAPVEPTARPQLHLRARAAGVSTPTGNLTVPPGENLTDRRGDEPYAVGTS
jgi:hypothetical protein